MIRRLSRPRRAPWPAPVGLLAPLLLAAGLLGGCSGNYSPDTYATRAVQQANKVEQGVVVGVRQVQIRADGATGAAAGAAAGGVAGSQVGQGGAAGAFGAIGGGLIGGLLGAAGERVAGDAVASEYVVRKANGEMVSVTQRDEQPLPIGQKVLVIAGAQARIVPDYTVPEPGAAGPSGTGPSGTPPSAGGPSAPQTPAPAVVPPTPPVQQESLPPAAPAAVPPGGPAAPVPPQADQVST